MGLHMDALPLPPPARKPVPGRTGPAFPDDGAQPGWLEPTSGLRSFLRSPAGDGPADPRRWRDGPLVLLPGSTPIPEPEVFLRAHVEAAAALSRRLVVQRGWAGLCAEMVDGSPPPHVHFSDALPYGWLLGRAAAAILTGRPGALARAVRAGCPVLVEPRGRDAFNNGRRVLELGVGRVLDPRSATTASVRRMLAERVMTPSVRRRCTALRRRLAGAPDGASQACDALEAWLEAGGS
ncbi:MAG: hypothetical protein FIA95_01955 [Gemmatimonadetes bacterium]|nr:hypothetical protein [Gemmatimonadota bacterium]